MWNDDDEIRYDLNDRSAVRRLEKLLKPQHETTTTGSADQTSEVATRYSFTTALRQAFEKTVLVLKVYRGRRPA